MKKNLILIVVGMFLIASSTTIYAGETAPQKVVDLANTKLANIGTDPIIVEAVKA